MAAPGWYQDSTYPGYLRWWDGTQWTDNYHPVQTPAAPAAPAAPAPQPYAAPAPPQYAAPTAPRGSKPSVAPIGLLGGLVAVGGALLSLVACFLPLLRWGSYSANEWDAHKWLVAVVLLAVLVSFVLLVASSGVVPIARALGQIVGGLLVLLTLVVLVRWFMDWRDIEKAVSGGGLFGTGGPSRGIGLFVLPFAALVMGAGAVVAAVAPAKKAG